MLKCRTRCRTFNGFKNKCFEAAGGEQKEVNSSIKYITVEVSQADKGMNSLFKFRTTKQRFYSRQKTEQENTCFNNYANLFIEFQTVVEGHSQIFNSWSEVRGHSTKGWHEDIRHQTSNILSCFHWNVRNSERHAAENHRDSLPTVFIITSIIVLSLYCNGLAGFPHVACISYYLLPKCISSSG